VGPWYGQSSRSILRALVRKIIVSVGFQILLLQIAMAIGILMHVRHFADSVYDFRNTWVWLCLVDRNGMPRLT